MRQVSKIQIKFEDNMWSQKVRYIILKISIPYVERIKRKTVASNKQDLMK